MPSTSQALEQHEIERDPRDLAGGKPDDEKTASPRQRAQSLLAQWATDRIEDNIDPVLPAQTLECLAQVLLRVVDGLLRATGSSKGEFLVGGSAGDDTRPHDATHFNGSEPDSARSAEHCQELAFAKTGTMLEGIIGGAIGDGQRSRAFEVELRRDFHQPVRRHRDAFSHCIEIGVAHDAVAGLELLHTRSDALDDAGELASRRKWKWRLGLVLAGNHERVEKIEPRRRDPCHDLALGGDGVGNFRENEVVGGAETVAEKS